MPFMTDPEHPMRANFMMVLVVLACWAAAVGTLYWLHPTHAPRPLLVGISMVLFPILTVMLLQQNFGESIVMMTPFFALAALNCGYLFTHPGAARLAAAIHILLAYVCTRFVRSVAEERRFHDRQRKAKNSMV